jgi:zinc protease
MVALTRLAAGLLTLQLVSAQQVTVSEHKLANGMKLLIHPDHDIPSVAMYLFFKVGSRNERSGATGMSHFFEHMMFNGAKKYGPKQFDVQMEKNGGRNNAYTSRDLTVYTNWFPPSALPLMFDMEADRIRDLAVDPKMTESERGVVYSERRSNVDNDNGGLLDEQFWAAAFTAHPYHWPIIGWASDIEAWTRQDLLHHFRMGYAPNNCVLVVAGSVKPAEVLRLARTYLEPIPRQTPPPAVRTKEPEQMGERRVTVRKPAQSPMVMIGYHVPETRHADNAAIDILGRVLTEGRSSRLYRRLVDRDQFALSVNSGKEESLDPGLFVVLSQVRPGVAPAKVEAAVYEEMAAIGKGGVDASEMAKVRNLVLAGFYKSIATISEKANAIGRFEIFHGGYGRLNTYAADLEKVTTADVQRVARQYLTAKNRTVATLEPEE